MHKSTYRTTPWMLSFLIVGVLTLGFGFNAANADHGTGTGQSFLTLDAGFTQEIFGVHPVFMGGVAFAPDGDPLVANCIDSGPLQRFDRQGVAPEVNGTKLHPVTTLPSDAGCGLTGHPNGAIYSNTFGGVVKLNANTGALLAGPFGPSGNTAGIATDPQTGTLVYAGSDGTIRFVNAALTTTGLFSAATTGEEFVDGIFVDGIFFDPPGDVLFLAILHPSFALTIMRRDGTVVQRIPMSAGPDGIGFHTTAPKFVVTNNIDGTMTRFDFPGDDYTQVPVQSVFASGGHRGDLIQAGPDGCLFVTQAGTRYDNGTVTGENSLVRICGGSFAPPPGVGIEAQPASPRVVCGGRCKVFITCNLLPNVGAPCANPVDLFVRRPRSSATSAKAPRRMIRFAFGVAKVARGQTAPVSLKFTKMGKKIARSGAKKLTGILEIRNVVRPAIGRTPVRTRLK